jgi:hypothetical protein
MTKLRLLLIYLLGTLGIIGLNGCKGWILDYGKVAAQFTSSTIEESGQPYIGRKVTVKGTVTKHELDNASGKLTMVLDDIIRCVSYDTRNEDELLSLAASYEIGRVAYFDGFLVKCEPGNVLLDPVSGRDPKAPFERLK